MRKIRIIHYLNQFFGGLGGEEQAETEPQWFDGPKGPGVALERLAPEIEVVATIVAGDNYMAEHLTAGTEKVIELIEQREKKWLDAKPGSEPQLLLAGPAFNAGRYGMACGALCQAVQNRLRIPAVTALYIENPAVAEYRKEVTMLSTGRDVMAMHDALEGIARVGVKLVRGEPVIFSEDGTIPRGLRQNYRAEATGAERAIEMLLKKLSGAAFETEYVMPVFDRVAPARPIESMATATIALATSGGIVPRGNPDRIEAASASKYGEYPLEGLNCLTAASHQSVHGGYDPTYANADPNRVLPLDVMRDFEREGRIGRLHNRYFATVGNATSVKRAARFGQEIAAQLVNEGVQAVIFTST